MGAAGVLAGLGWHVEEGVSEKALAPGLKESPRSDKLFCLTFERLPKVSLNPDVQNNYNMKIRMTVLK